MQSDAQSSTLDPRHPILRQEYAVYTPAIDEMVVTLGDWIDQKLTGAYVYGPSRYGKSRAVKWYVRAELEARFGPHLPMVIWIRPVGRLVETAFWNRLLAASKFHFYNPLKQKRCDVARFLFKQQLITLARQARQNYVLLIVDEAHELSLIEMKWLVGIQNDLDDEGYRFSVFSIGSHQMAYQPDYMARTGNAHIAVRLFSADARFHGVMDAEQLEYVLRGYDVDSDWPASSGVSYLQYFAPDAFARGRRLGTHAKEIWHGMELQRPPEFTKRDASAPTGIPMRTVALSAEKLLRQLAEGTSWDEVLSDGNLATAIAGTGLYDHLRKISGIE